MSEKSFGAANQQGSRRRGDPSETIRRASHPREEIKAYLLGALHDGTLNKSKRFRISQKGTDWLKVLQMLLKRVGYNSWIYKEGKARKVYVLETLANFLDFRFNPARLIAAGEKKAYIRGFFDAEGGIPRNPDDRFYIQLVQKNKEKLKKIKEMLENLGIVAGKIHNPSKNVDPNYWRMYILSNSQKRFARDIFSWHPRKITTLESRMKI